LSDIYAEKHINVSSEQYFDDYRDATRAHYMDGGFIIVMDKGQFCVLDHDDIQKYRTPQQIKFLDEQPVNWDEQVAKQMGSYPVNDHLVDPGSINSNLTKEEIEAWCARYGYRLVPVGSE
jgi:hypothetical protein